MSIDFVKAAKVVQFENNGDNENYVSRSSFRCVKLSLDANSEWVKSVLEIAKEIEPKLNSSQANTGEERAPETKTDCNNAGLIAEYACYEFLKWLFGEIIEKPKSEGAKNQIDIDAISALGKKLTIEVRSSFVNNGIIFALFMKDKFHPGYQYFDVIGPYTNGYKPDEECKDFYMRVLFPFKKQEFESKLENNSTIDLYITGGVTGAMLYDRAFSQLKHLAPSGGEVEVEADYRVVPLYKSLDIYDFVAKIGHEANITMLKKGVLKKETIVV